MNPAAQPLIDLATSFVAGDIDAASFEVQYLAAFETSAELSDEAFFPLDNLFVDDAELREPPDDLDGDGLRAEAREALRRLGVR